MWLCLTLLPYKCMLDILAASPNAAAAAFWCPKKRPSIMLRAGRLPESVNKLNLSDTTCLHAGSEMLLT